MSRFTYRVTIIAGVLLAGWLLLVQFKSGSHHSGIEISSDPSGQSRALPRAPDLGFDTEQPEEEEVDEPPTEYPRGAFSNQRVWRTRDLDYLRSLDGKDGFRIRRIIPQLGWVLVSGSEDVLDRFRPEDAEETFSFPVFLPEIGGDDSFDLAGMRTFEGKGWEYLGIDEIDPNWGKGVVIALLDTGIQPDNSALANADIRSIKAITGLSAIDENGHGTAIAGAIVGNDAYTPGIAQSATLLSYAVLDQNGSGSTFDLAAGIVQAVDDGADVINISAGSNYSSQDLNEAVAYAAAHGTIIVAASGNGGEDKITFPARYESVFAVGAMDPDENVAVFSNGGEELDLVAPGVGNLMVGLEGDYILAYGTSGATGEITAVFAVAKTLYPNLSNTQVAEIVISTANEIGEPGLDDRSGNGIPDVGRILNSDDSKYLNLAIAPLYLDQEEAGETQIPLYLTAENRGNAKISGGQIHIEVDGAHYTHPLPTLNADEISSVMLPLSRDKLESESGVKVTATVIISGGDTDANSEDNTRTLTIHLTEPE